MTYVSIVFCRRQPLCRAHCLSICHIVVIFIVERFLLPYTEDPTTTSTRLDPNTTPSFRARVSGDCRKWRIASRVL